MEWNSLKKKEEFRDCFIYCFPQVSGFMLGSTTTGLSTDNFAKLKGVMNVASLLNNKNRYGTHTQRKNIYHGQTRWSLKRTCWRDLIQIRKERIQARCP